jgi:hypothetical protein
LIKRPKFLHPSQSFKKLSGLMTRWAFKMANNVSDPSNAISTIHTLLLSLIYAETKLYSLVRVRVNNCLSYLWPFAHRSITITIIREKTIYFPIS